MSLKIFIVHIKQKSLCSPCKSIPSSDKAGHKDLCSISPRALCIFLCRATDPQNKSTKEAKAVNVNVNLFFYFPLILSMVNPFFTAYGHFSQIYRVSQKKRSHVLNGCNSYKKGTRNKK